jgi:tRNA (guanosine-2'-O-)-methyltransferase
MSAMEQTKKSKPSLRAKADKIKSFRCKNLIVVIEYPNDLRNIGTVIRNVNALGVEKAYLGIIESLNLGTSSGIVLYEITRQRRDFQDKLKAKIAAKKKSKSADSPAA